MKLMTILTCSTLLMAGAAFAAADTSGSAAPATTAPAATTGKHHAMANDDCAKDAASKGLHGKDRHAFLKTCRAGKK
jgi:hypothetical protein